MTIYLLNSDARNIPLTDHSVQCIITSPPYYGLRDYGTAQWDGGDPMCNHVVGNQVQDSKAPGAIVSGVRPGVDASVCKVCGAIRIDKQIGLERTPQEYVASIIAVMRECWRVLKDDGVLWLNLGDSYANNRGTGASPEMGEKQKTNIGSHLGRTVVPNGYKQKDLIGIPWRCAFALQDDGWYLRSDIIWSKPNPMPESVTDRPTKAHEYIFLLTKRARYYYDADAIAEPLISGDNGSSFVDGRDLLLHPNTGRAPRKHDGATIGGNCSKIKDHVGNSLNRPDGKRNRRSVWTVATTPYSGAHFATFPPKLIEPMVLAGSRPGDLILDPFAGTATVGRVAIKHQRRFVGLDLNLKYIGDLAKERTSKVQVSMQFATEP